MTVKEFIIMNDIIANVEDIQQALGGLKKPSVLGGVRVPDSLDDITMGQLMQLQGITNAAECVYVPCAVILDLNEKQVNECRLESVLAFCRWTADEVTKINELFGSASVEPTAEETKAGVERMSFGVFGLLDYYATRMGITDHTQVESVPWVRVLKVMQMDAEKIKFERRLQTIYAMKK
ncbi:hypothetical protein [uncultured Bacteroides sp.]|jgi:hypothetical protein|uniref:hypothetical protein n=1 Tax=uncultured Bacteroides sp. TaxID=162156 RepID=UPI00205AD120|nr:hypothetical protein [uncultured Bacteroides sp.]DAL45100.1 MAG TPA_asm: hypothetical protein [Caudoviricetes sp.]